MIVLASVEYIIKREDRKPFVTHRFELGPASVARVRGTSYEFGFDGFGEAVYYRTYSRPKADGTQEDWHDTVIRTVNGVMSIRKDWYMKNYLPWEDAYWQEFAEKMAIYFVQMKCMPPGRGLAVMGTDFVYERGSMALFNCGASKTDHLSYDCNWIMDALMCGVGVGFGATSEPVSMSAPNGKPYTFVIPDSREGWAESVERLILAYETGTNPVRFDYSDLRPSGSQIKGFGGIASGPEPLIKLHDRVTQYLDKFISGETSSLRMKADIINALGCCVVAGNVRRSAEIMLGSADDKEFWDLKNYELHPEREEIGWMSNNSVALSNSDDFSKIPMIAKRIRANGEPGFVNLKNVQKFARFGRHSSDKADCINPCGEIPLENKELCNLFETYPSRCADDNEFFQALKFGAFYTQTVSLLPTHRLDTNKIIARNRRVGISISGVADWSATVTHVKMTKTLREGYALVKEENENLARDAGVSPSIRLTTIKPSGTVSQLAGVSPGMHFPTFKYAIRRMRVAQNSPIAKVLRDAGYNSEKDVSSDNTDVFDFVINQGRSRPATDVSMWEQAMMLVMLQREWADNAVSCTIYFDPEKEGGQLEHMLAEIAPLVKSVSVLPHTQHGVYKQAPYEGITYEEYLEHKSKFQPINWSGVLNTLPDLAATKFCSNDTCELVSK